MSEVRDELEWLIEIGDIDPATTSMAYAVDRLVERCVVDEGDEAIRAEFTVRSVFAEHGERYPRDPWYEP